MSRLRMVVVILWAMVVVTWRRLVRGPVHPAFRWRKELIAYVLRRGLTRVAELPLPLARRRLPEAPLPRKLAPLVTLARGSLGGRPVETTTPRSWTDGDPTVLYLHGGGYTFCSPGTHRDLVARIAAASGARCCSLDYRLAPEHPFPAALEDSLAAYLELLDRGLEPRRLLLAGDSAGGGLALATLLRLRAAGRPLPAGAVLLSPWVDLRCQDATLEENARYCYLQREVMELHADLYLQEHEATEPEASPVLADLQGLPPLLIQTGSAEGIHASVLRLVERATEAGLEVTLQVGEGMFHVWQAFSFVLPEGRPYIDKIGGFIRQRCG